MKPGTWLMRSARPCARPPARRPPAPLRLTALLAGVTLLAACGSTTASNSSTATTPDTATSASTTGTTHAHRPAPAAIPAAVPGADWPTFDFNAQRTGVGPAATGITAGNVRSLRVRVVHLNGTVDSAPVELHAITVAGSRRDVVFVTTTYGRTLAIDAGTGKRLWEYTPADIGGYQGTAQVTTASPVLDPGRAFVYASSPDGLVHKLSVATGREVRSTHWPARVTYDPGREKIASALNISGASLIVVTGGYYGDAPVYQGHLVTIDRASGRITHVFNTLCSNRTGLINPPSSCRFSDSAIWARAGAVVEPGSGRLLIATGNADFNGATNWGDSVLELSAAARLVHNWTPADQAELKRQDADLGSTAPAIVTVGGRRLAVQGGKDARLHLLDLDRLDGTSGPAGPRMGGQLQSVSSPGSGEVMTAPVVWTAGGRPYLFVADNGGTAAYLVHGGAHPGLTRAWANSTPGTSPVLAGGLLYVYDELDGALDVYAPGSGARLASLAAASGHWNSPIVVGGRIIEPVGNYQTHATSGELYIWHPPGR